MIRFCQKEDINEKELESALTRKPLYFDENIWEKGKEIFRYIQYSDKEIYTVPVLDQSGEIVCFAYQDSEANRELRMLEELERNMCALQFPDIFPEYDSVMICGCNELAVSFAAYLQSVGIHVYVTGDYWDFWGYKSDRKAKTDGRKRLVLYAEGILFQSCEFYEKTKRSVSPEFECIDRIYEKNVLEKRIHDTIGSAEEFFKVLKKEEELIILGVDRTAQDTYDILMAHGIDIAAFAVEGQSEQELLGKKALSIADAIKHFQNPVFINCRDSHGALGEEWTEYFYYRGYKRNVQYFLIRDYIGDIPHSNLVHVLHGKKIFLAGDQILCNLLSDYLYKIENGEVNIRYIDTDQELPEEQADIRCLVVPDYYNILSYVSETKKDRLKAALSRIGFKNYTEYFSNNRAFVLVEQYLNMGVEKYSDDRLTPKGILLGRIPGWSGNYFLRGILDGHPEILTIPVTDLNDNLFFYCMCLANLDSDKIIDSFWEIYDREACNKDEEFPYPERFEESARRLLVLKKRFTSQELFVLFHIAYAEMMRCERIPNVSELVIYWEPHLVPRNAFAFFAVWLEDKKVDGQTIVLRRNNIVRSGSGLARAKRGWESAYDPYAVMFLDDSVWGGFHLQYSHWTEYKMRFEDIKLHPRKKLTEICERLGIKWSDHMMWTTSEVNGKSVPLSHCGSVDFDLKAVFDKYEEFLSEFDRFRISIASAPYQKRYGFTYENILKFSRRELQELFLKPFLFEEDAVFENGTLADKRYGWLRGQLWNVRKHMVLDDISPEFGRIEINQTAKERMAEYYQEEINEVIEYAKTQKKLILYGTGDDCKELLKRMDADTRARILFSDRKAETKPYMFEGKNVIPPDELCGLYKDYNIIVTRSIFRKEIEKEFHDMGIDPSRVFYNKIEIGEN